jgi:hypothetical protein
LPSGPNGFPSNSNANGGRGGRSYQNYRNDHFFFFFAPSGELILRDLSPCLTAIEVEDATPYEASLYALHGSNPRQRVIPRTNKVVYITFGTTTCFRFVWAREYQEEFHSDAFEAQDALAAHALALRVSGMTLTAPETDSLKPPMNHSRELRSRYSPSTGSSLAGTSRPIHMYRVLGEGTFGQVSKAVELTSGDIWAVKVIKSEVADDRWRTCFLREVEMLKCLRHVSTSLGCLATYP